ncbi:hypothetical protein C1645_832181 [Glomus cerebriforme]|uniref:Uncharacterized protein n=1 Tax=Glomus cerebriforme TaxID=658196 RepID=A0A397SIN6_9GLOM|nr:hypothetical protein C1645_832181 [Glomus cerebriforme]
MNTRSVDKEEKNLICIMKDKIQRSILEDFTKNIKHLENSNWYFLLYSSDEISQVYKNWQESIENIKKNNKNVPDSICSFCTDLLDVDNFKVQKQETIISLFQKMSNLLQNTNTLEKRENTSDAEEE